jgi:Hemerythrin HHE cation binding domain
MNNCKSVTTAQTRPVDRLLRWRRTMIDLAREHVLMNTLCEDIVARAETGEWRLCDAIWDELARRLRAHMLLEERSLFPGFLKAHPDRRAALAELQAEHGTFRAAIERLGIAVQLQELRSSQVRSLVSQLDLHSQRENLEFYPWVRMQEQTLERPREV